MESTNASPRVPGLMSSPSSRSSLACEPDESAMLMVYLSLLTLQRNISSPNFKSRMSSVLIGCTSSTQQAHKAQNEAVLIKYESIAINYLKSLKEHTLLDFKSD